jgi:hypothetical protein
VLAESLLSVTAAFITAVGCESMDGVRPFSIAVNPAGVGYAKYPSNQANAINLKVEQDENLIFFGAKYIVEQDPAWERQYVDKESIANFDGELAFSHGGAIMISNSYFDLYEYDLPFPWDEHNIKDFWLEVESGVVQTAHIEDSGIEAITKDDYPISKWRQDSDHWRWNYDLGPGHFEAEKQLITPYNVSDCTISMAGSVNNALGVTQIRGDIEVDANDF